MRDPDDQYNIQRYSELASEYGIDVRSLDWGSVESQQLRFRVLAEVGELENTRILDVGCGLGDLYLWLNTHRKQVTYTGIDITPKMIELAHQRIPECLFKISDLETVVRTSTERFDYVFASGIFCKRSHEPFAFMKNTIRSMFNVCEKGVAFNSLSQWAGVREPDEYYADPTETLSFCRTLTPWVSLRHDYHDRDFTIYMYRDRNR